MGVALCRFGELVLKPLLTNRTRVEYVAEAGVMNALTFGYEASIFNVFLGARQRKCKGHSHDDLYRESQLEAVTF